MSSKPTLLDLFCGEGGIGTGYDQAGFDVTGVDKFPMTRYAMRAAAKTDLSDYPEGT